MRYFHLNFSMNFLCPRYKIIIWKAQGVAHPNHPEEEETSPHNYK